METKQHGLEQLREYLLITLGTLIAAVAVYFFLVPSHVTVGSVSGLVVVLTNFIPLSVSTLTMIINVALLIFGFVTLGREFGAKTVYTSLLLPVFLGIFEYLFPNQPSITGDPFLDMLGDVLVVSLGQAILFNLNASSGGLDIIAKFLNRYFHMELGQAITAVGFCAALSSILVYDGKIVFLSLLGTWLNGLVLDHFILGFHVKKRVCIISRKQEEILDLLLRELNCGATLYESEGAYDRQKRTEIITIMDRSQYAKLVSRLHDIDPLAFVTVYTVNEVLSRYGNR